MNKNLTSKIATLFISFIVFCLAFKTIHDWNTVGIYLGCRFSCRMTYPFFHANIFHATLNLWCLLAVVFTYDTSLWRLSFTFFVAMAVPSFCLSDIPTVGLSGVVFMLFGSISFEVRRKSYYQLCMIAYLVAGFLFPNTNAWIHLYCYVAGVAVALLNKPVKIG